METNSPDREVAARLLELADEARASTVYAAALPWWPFALAAGCAGVICGAVIVNAWVVFIIGIAMMATVAVLLHRLGDLSWPTPPITVDPHPSAPDGGTPPLHGACPAE